jgi:hypothetical protein
MPEIKTEIKGFTRSNGDIVYRVGKEHTVADIARWLIKHDWQDDILTFLNSPDKFL